MKQLLKRVTAWLLCAALLVVPMQLSAVTASAQGEMPVLAFVPLDNRPVCTDRIVYAAEAAGFDIEMPDEGLYRTYLDNQGVNANGTQHGDGTAIAAWLLEMEAAGCDYYIIHLDQMFSGGLVGSRYPDSSKITKAETDIIDNCLIPLTNDKNNRVYFVDTVMRLASTGSYKGYEQGEYGSFREYAEQDRYVLNMDFSTTDYNTSVGYLDQIVKYYQTGVNGETLTYYTGVATDWKSPLNQAQIDEYHSFRRRKLDLLNLMMQFANRNATYIIGVDDANPGNTIQSNEIAFIHGRMKALGYDYTLSADTDSSGMMALARCTNDYYNAKPTVLVRYFGNQIDVPADDYDIGTLRENVSEHIRCLNATEVTSGDADIEVLVLTKADTEVQNTGVEDMTYTANINKLIAQAKANIAANKPTIIIEASTEAGYFRSWVKGFTNLQDELLKNVEISKLLGYSNWNTVGNTIGLALGTGVSRYAYLANADMVSAASNISFLKSLTYSYVKDITYNARNKNQDFPWTFQYWITNKAGGTGWNNGNFYSSMIAYTGSTYKEDWELCAGEHYVNNELEWSMMRGGDASAYSGSGQAVLNAMMAGEFYIDLNGNVETGKVGTITLDKFHCPWYRQFEITFEVYPTMEYYNIDAFVTGIPALQTTAVFADRVAWQLNASSVVIKDLSGAVAANDTAVGTGFTVTANGTTYELMIKGDTNGDGLSNSSDVRSVMANVVGSVSYSEVQSAAADHDGNSKVTSTDARRMLQDVLSSKMS